LFIGRAQEKTGLFRTEKRRGADGRAYPWIVRATGVVNHFYVYAVDADFGPFFLKFCSYFPYNARLCINGHEWAKRQAVREGIGHTALDNGFATCADPAALQAICDRLGPPQIQALLDKWLTMLPSPFTDADRAAAPRGQSVGLVLRDHLAAELLDHFTPIVHHLDCELLQTLRFQRLEPRDDLFAPPRQRQESDMGTLKRGTDGLQLA